jgi:phosphate:Na+ symporter
MQQLTEIGAIVTGILGGLALFLYGMEQLTTSMKLLAGQGLKQLLSRLTDNRFFGVMAGTVVTAIIQSSSVTTVLLVGFISAGLMTLKQSIGVMLGADIGTTITAQIVAFKVTRYALLLVSIGFALLFFSRRKRVQQYGTLLMGLGLIFFGMGLMSEATIPLRSYPPFISAMQQLANPVWGILVGLLFTVVVQSSSATMGVVITLAAQGFVSLEAGIALAFGANIGTTVTALLAAIGKPREAVQAAVLHALFKFAGVVIWLPFIGLLAEFVRVVSPASPILTGTARLAVEAPRQIANAHTIFNVGNMLIFIWFTEPLARLMNWLIPLKGGTAQVVTYSYNLDDTLLDTPALALERVRLELERLGETAAQMTRQSLPVVLAGDSAALAGLANLDDEADSRYEAVVAYLGQLSQRNLSEVEVAVVADYLTVAGYLEHIGDMVETNLVAAGQSRLRDGVQVSAATGELLFALHSRVCWAVETSVEGLITGNPFLGVTVVAAKEEVNNLAAAAQAYISQRLTADGPGRLAVFAIENEIVEYLKRVYYFAKRIAKVSSLNNPDPAGNIKMP